MIGRHTTHHICVAVREAADSPGRVLDIAGFPETMRRWARVLAAEFNLDTLDGCLTEAATEKVK